MTKIDEYHWQVAKEFTYYVGKEGSDEFITVPLGFTSDLASVPWGLWNLFPKDGLYSQAAVLHDFMLTHGYPKSKADKVFYEAMGVLKVPGWKRSMMFFAVRMFHLF